MYVNHLAEKNRLYLTIQKIYITINGLFQKKSTPPRRKACWKILTGGAVNSSGNSDGRGSLNVKIHPRGLLSILLMFQLLQLIKKKLLCVFQFYYSFKLQTSYHIYFKFPSIGSPSLLLSAFVEATCDNLKISRKIT